MLLWITDTPDLLYETESLLIRTPSQLAAINPQEPMLVVIDVPQPQVSLNNWTKQRKRATLWWQPGIDVPSGHCSAIDTDCQSVEFIPLLNNVYHQEGIINFDANEIELVLCKHSYLRIFSLPTEFGELIDDQTWQVGYIIYRYPDRSIDDIELAGKIIHSRFNIKNLCCLFSNDIGADMLMTFSDQYHLPSYEKKTSHQRK